MERYYPLSFYKFVETTATDSTVDCYPFGRGNPVFYLDADEFFKTHELISNLELQEAIDESKPASDSTSDIDPYFLGGCI